MPCRELQYGDVLEVSRQYIDKVIRNNLSEEVPFQLMLEASMYVVCLKMERKYPSPGTKWEKKMGMRLGSSRSRNKDNGLFAL